MPDTRQRATELVANALAPEEDYFTMDKIEDILMESPHIEFDARIAAQRASDDINYYKVLDAERRGSIDLGPQGTPEAMTADFDPEGKLRSLAHTVVARHRQAESDYQVTIYDQKTDTDNRPLPPWYRHNPKSANVIRGLVAHVPDRLFVIRGRFTPLDLLTMVSTGSDETGGRQCSVNLSVECDPDAKPPRGSEWWEKVYNVFTHPLGDYLIYFVACGACYYELFVKDGAYFDTFDPKHDMPVE